MDCHRYWMCCAYLAPRDRRTRCFPVHFVCVCLFVGRPGDANENELGWRNKHCVSIEFVRRLRTFNAHAIYGHRRGSTHNDESLLLAIVNRIRAKLSCSWGAAHSLIKFSFSTTNTTAQIGGCLLVYLTTLSIIIIIICCLAHS